jgi:hypothetical protein
MSRASGGRVLESPPSLGSLLVTSGQITLRKLDGHEKIATITRARVTSAA